MQILAVITGDPGEPPKIRSATVSGESAEAARAEGRAA